MLLGLAPAAARAATSTWNLDGNGNWGTAGNWAPSGAPNAVDAAVLFGSVITANRTVTVNGSNRTIGSISINDDNNYTFNSNRLFFDVTSGNATLMVAGGGSPTFGTVGITLNDPLQVTHGGSGTLTFNGTATFDLNGHNVIFDGAGATSISRPIAGATGQVIQAGTGPLTVSGNNSYAGGLLVRAGTVQATGNNNALGAGAVTLGDSGTGGGDALALLGTGTASRTYANNVTVNNYGGTVTLGGNTTTTGDVTTFSGTLTLNRDVFLQETNTANTAAMTQFTGVIDGAGGFTKTEAGIVRLSGANTFGGNVAIRSGTLQITGDDGALSGATVTLGDSGTGSGDNLALLGVGAAARTYANDLVVADFGNSVTLGGNTTGGTVTTFSGDLALDRAVNLQETNNNAAARTEFTGQITTADDLTKTGAGRVRIDSASNDSSMTGNVVVSTGTLIVAGGGAIGNSSDVSISTGAFFNVAANETVGSVGGAGNLTLDAGVVLTTGNNNFDTTLSGRISGADAASGLTKIGTGTLTLTFNNTYTGDTNINGGVLRMQNNGALGNATFVASGATLALAGGFITPTANALTLNGSGVAGQAALYGAAGDNEWRGNVTLAAASTIGTAGGTTLEVSGNIGGANNLVVAGAGAVLLSGTNTYTGATTVRSGTLLVNANAPSGADSNLGNSTAAVELGDSGTGGGDAVALLMADANGGSTVARNITVNNFGGSATLGGLNASGTNTFSGVVTLNRDVVLSTAGGTVSFTGNVTGAGDLAKEGGGTVLFSSANNNSNMTGNISVSTGILGVAGGGALGDNTAVTLAGGTNFNVTASETVGSVGGAGNVTLSNGQVLTAGGNNQSTTLSGVMGGGNAASGVVKTGTGALTLGGTAANTFTGNFTISGGTVELAKTDGTAAVAGARLTINAGGTLLSSANEQIGNTTALTLNGGAWSAQGHSETLGTLTLSANSILDLGAGASVLNFANSSGVAWTGGAVLTIENWNGLIAGGGTDQIYFGNSSGGLTGGAGQLAQIQFLNPAGFAPGLYEATILATGEIVPVPEPSTGAAGAALALLAGAWEWRRRRRPRAAP